MGEFKRLLRVLFLIAGFASFRPGLLGQTGTADFADIQKRFIRASEAEKAGNLELAIKEYQEILRLRPEMAEIHNKLGFIYFLQNRYPDAIQAFKQALRLRPGLFASSLGLGMSLFRYSAFEEAITPLKTALSINPADPQAMFFLGSTYLSLERYDEAVPSFLRFVRNSPQDQDGLYALTLAAEKLYVESFVDLAKLYPDSARAHQVQAQRLAVARKWDKAIAEYKKVLAISPRLEQVHLALGNIYLTQGLAIQARTEYEKELEVNPYDPLARAGLGKPAPRNAAGVSTQQSRRSGTLSPAEGSTLSRIQTLVQSGECSKALEVMNSEIGSPSAVPWPWEVNCFLQLGDFESLMNVLAQVPSKDTELLYWKGLSMQQLTSRSFDALTRLEADSARVHELKGRLAAEADDEPAALQEFKLAEARDPELPGIHYAIGHMLMRNRQLPEAVNEFLAELKADPYNPIVECELGSTYLKLRDPDKGIPLLEAGLERRPDLLDARRDLGRAFGQKDNWEAALTHFQKVATANPTDYSIYVLIGDAYKKLGRMAEADAAFKKGRELQAADLSRTQGMAKSILNQDIGLSSESQPTTGKAKEAHKRQ